jgi:hypothetical protein
VKLDDGVKLIEVNRDVESVIDDILACENMASSSLHGIIEAHAYGISACWIERTGTGLIGDGTKFFDYFSSVGIESAKSIRIDSKGTFDLNGVCSHCFLPSMDLENMAIDLMKTCPFSAINAQLENRNLQQLLQ